MHVTSTRSPLTEHNLLLPSYLQRMLLPAGATRGTYCSLCRRTECSRRTLLVILAQLVWLGKIVCSFLSWKCRARARRPSRASYCAREQLSSVVGALLVAESQLHISDCDDRLFCGWVNCGGGGLSLRGAKLKKKMENLASMQAMG